MKKPDLLILITIWEFLTALVALVGVVFLAIYAFPTVIWLLWGVARAGVLFGLSVGTLLLLAYCGVAVAAGFGLLTGREWGRILAVVHSALSVFNVPVGTVIGILSIIYLIKPEVKEYFETCRSVQTDA